MATPRVLHLLWSGRIGGIERQVEAIVRYSARRNASAHLACLLDGRGPIGDQLVATGLACRLEMRTGWDPVGLLRLARLLRRLRPAIVHIHTHAIGAILVATVALPRATRFYSEHSPRSLRPDRKFGFLYWLLRRSVSRFVAATPTMALTMESRGVDPERLVVLPNCVPIERRAESPARDGPPTLGLVARLEPQKRVDLFIDVVAALRKRGVVCAGLIVGGGTCRVRLVEQTQRLGLENVVTFVGEQADVVPWLDQMDVFFMSSGSEPFGIAALEAMARGAAVVAMPCPGGLSDLVGRGGLLLPDRRVATAADAVARLLRSPDARRELRARAHAVLTEFDFDRVMTSLEGLYHDGFGRP